MSPLVQFEFINNEQMVIVACFDTVWEYEYVVNKYKFVKL